MTPITWVVEHSLQASERFRHLTVKRDPKLDFVDIDAIIKEIVDRNYQKYWE